jgi:hypothetical protein
LATFDVGLFDLGFDLYGWEDLELGVRLKIGGIKMVKCLKQWAITGIHKTFHSIDLRLIEQNSNIGQMGVVFYKKASSSRCEIMIQNDGIPPGTVLNILSVGGAREHSMRAMVWWLIDRKATTCRTGTNLVIQK